MLQTGRHEIALRPTHTPALPGPSPDCARLCQPFPSALRGSVARFCERVAPPCCGSKPQMRGVGPERRNMRQHRILCRTAIVITSPRRACQISNLAEPASARPGACGAQTQRGCFWKVQNASDQDGSFLLPSLHTGPACANGHEGAASEAFRGRSCRTSSGK